MKPGANRRITARTPHSPSKIRMIPIVNHHARRLARLKAPIKPPCRRIALFGRQPNAFAPPVPRQITKPLHHPRRNSLPPIVLMNPHLIHKELKRFIRMHQHGSAHKTNDIPLIKRHNDLVHPRRQKAIGP